MALRPMTEADLDRVVELEEMTFPEPWTRDCFRLDLVLPGMMCLVAVEEDDVTGYLVVWQDKGAHVANIAVDPARRRRGIGRRLMKAAEAFGRSRRERRVWLEVRERNLGAQQFYLDLGFRPAGRRQGYYSNGEDALLLAKPIAPAT